MSEASQSSRGSIVSVLALVVALVALGVAVWVLVKEPASTTQDSGSAEPASVFTGTTTDDPKAASCQAFDLVRRGVQLNTNLQPPGGPQDATGTLAVGANARLSLYEGGAYLLARLQPDTPSELADAIRSFGNQLMDIGARSIAGIPNADPDQAARLKNADATSGKIAGLCK
ncbi:hypothetical protein [Mycobacterium lehmannii]|uniref:hypothetical protein n=1 Tax=Mycobacterium lehmannii TaxID=2048550 RepID=UPI000B93E1FD|nr:hypothetical protein [Mycobacterium lehmannii]